MLKLNWGLVAKDCTHFVEDHNNFQTLAQLATAANMLSFVAGPQEFFFLATKIEILGSPVGKFVAVYPL